VGLPIRTSLENVMRISEDIAQRYSVATVDD
jgi:hypothetical protein